MIPAKNNIVFLLVFFLLLPVAAVIFIVSYPQSTVAFYKIFYMYILLVSAFGIWLIYLCNVKEYDPPQRQIFWVVFLVILNGSVVRLLLAYLFFGNYDMSSYEIVAEIVQKGGNVYAETARYNYSPIWFSILDFLKDIQVHVSWLSYHFVVRSFLCIVDLITLVFLLLIAQEKGISTIKTAFCFYLNPVVFLITGFHGQFENLAILMLIIGIYSYLKLQNKPVWGTGLLWLFATVGLLVKHNIFYELIVCINYAVKRFWLKILLFCISSAIFLLLFVPYFDKGSTGIIQNVFLYSSGSGKYGITSLFNLPLFKYIFIVSLFLFPLFIQSKNLIKQCLTGMLFFLVCTTGVAIQYFVLPIALGALYPGRSFLIYSAAAAVCILGSVHNLHIPILSYLHLNIVWITATSWLLTELFDVSLNFSLKNVNGKQQLSLRELQ